MRAAPAGNDRLCRRFRICGAFFAFQGVHLFGSSAFDLWPLRDEQEVEVVHAQDLHQTPPGTGRRAALAVHQHGKVARRKSAPTGQLVLGDAEPVQQLPHGHRVQPNPGRVRSGPHGEGSFPTVWPGSSHQEAGMRRFRRCPPTDLRRQNRGGKSLGKRYTLPPWFARCLSIGPFLSDEGIRRNGNANGETEGGRPTAARTPAQPVYLPGTVPAAGLIPFRRFLHRRLEGVADSVAVGVLRCQRDRSFALGHSPHRQHASAVVAHLCPYPDHSIV